MTISLRSVRNGAAGLFSCHGCGLRQLLNAARPERGMPQGPPQRRLAEVVPRGDRESPNEEHR